MSHQVSRKRTDTRIKDIKAYHSQHIPFGFNQEHIV